jgi:hypothetical protein
VLWRLGRLLTRRGGGEAARATLARGEAILRELDERLELAKLVCFRAELAFERGEAGIARTLLEEVEAITAPLGLTPESELGRTVATLRARA